MKKAILRAELRPQAAAERLLPAKENYGGEPWLWLVSTGVGIVLVVIRWERGCSGAVRRSDLVARQNAVQTKHDGFVREFGPVLGEAGLGSQVDLDEVEDGAEDSVRH